MFSHFMTSFEPHFHAYLLQEDTDINKKVVYLSNLFLPTPVFILMLQVVGSHYFILLPYSLCIL